MRTLIVQAARGAAETRSGRLHRLWYHGLTLPYLAALFGRHGDVRTVEELLDPIPFDTDADLVAITTMGGGLVRALELADEFRRRGRTVVMGGPTASAYPDLVLQHADALAIGDGEGSIDRIAADFQSGKLQRVYKHDSPPTLAGTPVPRYDLVPRSRVGLYYPVEATRGCSIGCRFCLTTQLSGRRQRQKPLEEVARDIRAIQALGVHRVIFMDDNPTVDRSFFWKLVDTLTPLGVRWMANATAGAVPDEACARRLADSGCDMLAIGFETVNQRSLEAAGKGCYKAAEYSALIERLHRYGIQVTAMMVVGFDDDSLETYDRMRDFLIDNGVEMAIFHMLTPILGTPMHGDLQAAGRLLDLGLEHYTAEEAVFRPAQMDVEQLNAAFWRLYRQFYSARSIFKRLVARRPDRHLFKRVGSIAANLYMRSMVMEGRTLV